MNKSSPKIVILAGPNGAGKTTAALNLLKGALSVDEFVNADVIARGLSGFTPEFVSFQAGRAMLRRIHELAEKNVDFAFETTLASKSFRRMIISLKQSRNYQTHLIFLWLRNPKLALTRVSNRVKMGGHRVPDEVVLRRYTRGLQNLFTIYIPIVDSWHIYDNSSDNTPLLIARGSKSSVDLVTAPEIWQNIKETYDDSTE